MRADKSFFSDVDVLSLAKRLLNCTLCTIVDGKLTSGKIVETEAYRGKDDKACHAYNYKRTKRTETMYMEAGHAYIYLCYGIHNLFNIVSGPQGEPDAVLIRAIEPLDGVDEMLSRRKIKVNKPQLTGGPGVLTKALGINRTFDKLDLSSAASPIWIEVSEPVKDHQLLCSARVGIDYAEECVHWPWRFSIKNNNYVSR
jgi:DNA-3-methyladenine glycosylase